MKRRDLKILWSSNFVISNSGYARFTDDISQRAIKDGWNWRNIAWAGLAGGCIEHKGIFTYPQLDSAWGDDALFHHGNHFQANIRITMQDVHTLNPQWLAQMPNWIPYTPIDRDEIPQAILDNLRYANRIITFSKFGQKTLEKYGFASLLIPEGVDTSVFKPLDKKATRKELGFPEDKFIVGQIGANKPDGISRKSWQQSLDAFKLFSDKHPDAMFFFETNQGGGFDIEGYARHLGISDKMISVNSYMAIVHGSAEIMNKWLNALDMLVHPSSTEGFGLVITEAQSAGVPVIVNNCHSQPELVIEGKTGEITNHLTKIWTQGGGYIYIPDSQSIYDKMETLYKRIKEDQVKISTSCRAWIKANYDIDTIYEKQWKPFFERLQDEILPMNQLGDKQATELKG